jgi:ABC-type cobalamin/Fe3+-siderophores transport system ATPase subunit
VCDRIVLMREGRIAAQGLTTDVLTAAHVRDIYGVIADVRHHDRAGHLTVTPVSKVP